MPHSSGGGSHGGGSHGGGHGGSGSSSPSGIQHKYYPGSHRYVYYVNKRPQYIYSKNDPTKINMQGFLLSIVGTIFFFVFAVVAFIASILDVPTKLKATYNNPGVVIQDNAGIITNSSRLYNELYIHCISLYLNAINVITCIHYSAPRLPSNNPIVNLHQPLTL